VVLRRVIDDADASSVQRLVTRLWPYWWAESARAIEHGCCHAAFSGAGSAEVEDAAGARAGGAGAGAGGTAIGFVCHSVSRAGWLGPMGTDPAGRRGGIGQALLSAVCRDLMIAEMPTAEICWAGPLRFYAKSGATVSRMFRLYRKAKP
jgi:hypothetical protein